MKKILIILNAVKNNRGSEALIRGLIRICKKADTDNQLFLASSESDFQDKVHFEGIEGYVNRYSYKFKYSPRRIFAVVSKRILKKNSWAAHLKYGTLLKCAKDMDVVIVIGADNYDKSYNMYFMMHELNQILRENIKGKMYLYDCSLEESDIDTEVIKDFLLFDVVTVRECITLSNMLGKLPDNRLHYYPDPAFLMEPQEISSYSFWENGETVGINLSNLVLKDVYGSSADIILKNYYNMIEFILEKTSFQIALIPHVMAGQDISALKILYDKYKESKRILLIDDEGLSAPELKYIISKCRFFIGARTHATIAAYSMLVPTLVLGYSVKSVGIARDLFGTEQNYVISTQNLKTEDELKEGLEWLLKHEKEIKECLEKKIPQYKLEAWKMSELL